MAKNDVSKLLTLSDVTKGLYGSSGRTINAAVQVLKGVSFSVQAGEVHVLLGENGAGKSTLMKILCGAIPADNGEILFRGSPLETGNVTAARSCGIGLVAQELSLCPNLTVAQNIVLGREPSGFAGISLKNAKIRSSARAQLARLNVEIDVDTPVDQLSIAQQQMVEIAKALSLDPEVLVLDEPTSALADNQVEQLFTVVRSLVEDGVGIVYITHKLEEVFAIGHRVTVLRDGMTVGSKAVSEVDSTDELIALMVGEKLENVLHRTYYPRGEVALEVESISSSGVFRDISFTVHCGEIVGLAGIVGAGRSELVRAIFGIDRFDSGSLKVFGEEVKNPSPAEMIRRGIGYIPEDRKRQGIVPMRSVADNIIHVTMKRYSRIGWLPRRIRAGIAREMIKRLRIVVSTEDQEVRYLSGGNQQKVVLGKWLDAKPRIYIFDEPTRGIDVGAKASIYKLIDTLAGQGAAVLLISSEFLEVLGLSDRIYVMRNGSFVHELPHEQFDNNEVLGYAMGAEMVGSLNR